MPRLAPLVVSLVLAGCALAPARATALPPSKPVPADPLRARAERDRSLRIVVSLAERRLLVMSQADTLLAAPVAVGSGKTIRGLDRAWTFQTPRGVRTVLAKRTNPVWTPPDWMYVETAQEERLRVVKLDAKKPYPLAGGNRLVVQDGRVGVREPNGRFTPAPEDEHIVFGDVLFIPPVGTRNRRVEGELGRFALDTGDGYLLHGTPYESTVGTRVSHGCVRLRDADVAWLHEHVPVGTRVYVY